MRYLLPLLLAALVASCKAHMLETHGDKIQLFKTGQERPGKGGAIRWLRTGPASFQKARRADAERQMRSFCGGDYRITAEGTRDQFGSRMPIGAKVSFEMGEYWYAAFDCAGA